MWPSTYEDRLAEWSSLKTSCHHDAVPAQYMKINNWWFRCPLVNRSITWSKWPNPWQLLQQDGHCDLARSLGMLYTLMFIATDIDVEIVHCDLGNLVLVEQGKYIMNWAPGELLNIQSLSLTVINRVNGSDLFTF